MHYLIYKITNRLNNKFYVGKHKTTDKDDDYFGSGLLLKRAIQKHGKENFVKEILFELATEDEMNRIESDIVDEEFIARDDTYNVKLGGQGGFDHINKNQLWKTDNWFKVIGKNGKKGGDSYVKRLREDDDFRREVGQKQSAFMKRFQSINGNLFAGRKHSDESKKKMSRSALGKHSGEKNGVYGKHWYTNGRENKMMKPSDVTDGWYKGRT